jgi:hypothetical protein
MHRIFHITKHPSAFFGALLGADCGAGADGVCARVGAAAKGVTAAGVFSWRDIISCNRAYSDLRSTCSWHDHNTCQERSRLPTEMTEVKEVERRQRTCGKHFFKVESPNPSANSSSPSWKKKPILGQITVRRDRTKSNACCDQRVIAKKTQCETAENSPNVRAVCGSTHLQSPLSCGHQITNHDSR